MGWDRPWWVLGHTMWLALCHTHAGPVPQVFGMIFTCCLYKSLKLEHY